MGFVNLLVFLLLFSCSVMSDSLQPHGLLYARLPCPSLSPRVCSHFMFIESVMPSNCLILCFPLLLLPSIFPGIRVCSKEVEQCNRHPCNCLLGSIIVTILSVSFHPPLSFEIVWDLFLLGSFKGNSGHHAFSSAGQFSCCRCHLELGMLKTACMLG